MTPSTSYRLLQIALVFFGTLMLLLYPLAVVWPSGWAWHHGAPYQSDYFMMIVGLYATLGLFLANAARTSGGQYQPDLVHRVWSSIVHGIVMAVQSFQPGHHMGHLWGDVPALLLAAIVLTVLVRSSGITRTESASPART